MGDTGGVSRILFLDGDNALASQMAEAVARRCLDSVVEVTSAGIAPSKVDPRALEALSAAGLTAPTMRAKAIADLLDVRFDLVIAIDERAGEQCPMLPGVPAVVHWKLDQDDPSAMLDAIRERVNTLGTDGFLKSFVSLKRNFENLLRSLPSGVVVHDLNRRLVYFSPKAESITGFSQQEVLGRDCHEVFTPNLCGGECAFCQGCDPHAVSRRRYATSFLAKDGQRKDLEMSVVPLRNETGVPIGVLAVFNDQTELRRLERDMQQTYQFSGIIGQDHKMHQIYDLIMDLAQSDFPVVISGESGTGKELVARAIHNESTRKDKLFVPINCGALPEGTLESELFGHVRGAFTGAIRDKKGRFELAHGGTVFLDEIAELSPAMQVKLLRVLQEGTFEPVGSEVTRTVDLRVISATNKDLKERVKSGEFREDLYYRLAVVPIEMPPLRERRNDIELLARHFLAETAQRLGRAGISLSDDALSVMLSYSWPGNVRQLQNAIQFSMVKCHRDTVLPEHLPPELTGGMFPVRASSPPTAEPGKAGRKPKLSRENVEFALHKTAGNKAKAARMLGVGRATLYNFLEEHPDLRESGAGG
ncbi:MAG: PAS domain S-box protein [Chitinivibrionales bacterium]|nr:PAS domain S-box protein [Chitinivibrionales bacterium]MBD3396224.1 PAS domain S-box protein [Chitinivibrionales bacterium]